MTNPNQKLSSILKTRLKYYILFDDCKIIYASKAFAIYLDRIFITGKAYPFNQKDDKLYTYTTNSFIESSEDLNELIKLVKRYKYLKALK